MDSNYQSVTDLLDRERADNAKLRARIAGLKDLRGQTVRHVHRDDAVIITGAEYLAMRLNAHQAENADDFDWPADKRGN
jgi:hypothetical protein